MQNPDPGDAQLLNFYARMAPAYDAWAGGAHARAGARLAEVAAVRPEERAVDVGCGTGLTTHRLGGRPDAGGSSIGVDISPHMLAVAERNGAESSNAEFCLMDARRLIFRDESFDVVIFGQLLANVTDPYQALFEARRVLRPGARIVVSCQCRSLCTAAQQLFFERLEEFPLRVPRGSEQNAHLGEPAALVEMLEKAGFAGVEVTQLLTGNRAPDAHAWVDLMSLAGPWPYAVLEPLQSAGRARFEERLDDAMRDLGEGAYAYHVGFTFAVAQRR